MQGMSPSWGSATLSEPRRGRVLVRRNDQNVTAQPSAPMERYLDRQITSKDYFREVRKETARQVERELKQPSKEQPAK